MGLGPEALLGIVGCQSDAGQAGFAYVAKTYVGWIWFYSWIQSLSSLPLLCGQHSCLFFSLPAPTLAICLLVFAVGLKLEGLWTDWYKPIPLLGGHMSSLPPSGLFRASLPTSSAPECVF